jgi:hypothetical protein
MQFGDYHWRCEHGKYFLANLISTCTPYTSHVKARMGLRMRIDGNCKDTVMRVMVRVNE